MSDYVDHRSIVSGSPRFQYLIACDVIDVSAAVVLTYTVLRIPCRRPVLISVPRVLNSKSLQRL